MTADYFCGEKTCGRRKILHKFDPRVNDKKVGRLYDLTDNLMSTLPEKNFYNISDALYGRVRACYTDNIHISEECNKMIAERMADVFRKRFEQ